MICCQSIIWTVGMLFSDDKQQMSNYLRQKMAKIYPLLPQGDLFDFFLEFKSQQFKMWSQVTPYYVYDKHVKFQDIVIQTADTMKYSYFVDLVARNNMNTLMIGASGTGKSIVCKQYVT